LKIPFTKFHKSAILEKRLTWKGEYIILLMATEHSPNNPAKVRPAMLNILVCDDEPAFAASLSQKISALPTFSARIMRINCITQPNEMLEENLAFYDLLFLDIDMGEINGIDLARKLRQRRPDAVLIFVTNFIEYAPDGYEVNAFRYLAKSELANRLPRYFSDALSLCRERQTSVDILCAGEVTSISVQSIVYISSTNHEQFLHVNNMGINMFSTRMKMSELEALLSPHGFLRIHRSYLVNMTYLRRLQSTKADLIIDMSLPVSARSYRENQRKFMIWKTRKP